MKQSLRCAACLLWGEAGGKTTIEDNEHNDKTTFGKMSLKTTATVEDLYRVPENGKAELVNGELVMEGSDRVSTWGKLGVKSTAVCGTTV